MKRSAWRLGDNIKHFIVFILPAAISMYLYRYITKCHFVSAPLFLILVIFTCSTKRHILGVRCGIRHQTNRSRVFLWTFTYCTNQA